MKGNPLLPIIAAVLTPFLILTLIVTGTGLGLIAWKPPVVWSSMFGPSSGGNGAAAIVTDPSGVYVEGFLNSSGIQGPGGGGSMFLSKYDFGGSDIWTRNIGNTSDGFIDSMSIGAEGIYLSGLDLKGGLVEKFDLNGV